jgi:hypothetical protein
MLRHFKKQFVQSIGTPYQDTKHSVPDVSVLIRKVYDKAKELKSHVVTPGRKIAFRAQDILADGAELLRSKGIKSFERRYKKWVCESSMYSYRAHQSASRTDADGGSDGEWSDTLVDVGEMDDGP